MKKKFTLIIIVSSVFSLLVGCDVNRENDHIQIYNKSNLTSDDINIDIKRGYFYKNHEKFTIDEHTIGVTIYFSNLDEDDDSWSEIKE